MSSFERKISEPEIEEVDRERSSTVLTHTQSLIEQSLALKHKPNLEVINVKPKGKEDYKKQPYCTVCFRPFTTNFRQHHCRCCANAVCDPCSSGKINGQRSCDVCYLRFSNTVEEERKRLIIYNMELKGALLLRKKEAMRLGLERLRATKSQSQADQLSQLQLAKSQNDMILHLQGELRELDTRKNHVRTAMAELQREKQSAIAELEDMQRQLSA